MACKECYPSIVCLLDRLSLLILSGFTVFLVVPYLRNAFRASHIECGLIILGSYAAQFFNELIFPWISNKINRDPDASYRRYCSFIVLFLVAGTLVGLPITFWWLKTDHTNSKSVLISVFGVFFGVFFALRDFFSNFVQSLIYFNSTDSTHTHIRYTLTISDALGTLVLSFLFVWAPFDLLSDRYVLRFLACGLGLIFPCLVFLCLFLKEDTTGDTRRLFKETSMFFSNFSLISRNLTSEIWISSLFYLTFFMVVNSFIYFQIDWFVSSVSLETRDIIDAFLYSLMFAIVLAILMFFTNCSNNDHLRMILKLILAFITLSLLVLGLSFAYFSPGNHWFTFTFIVFGGSYTVRLLDLNVFSLMFKNLHASGTPKNGLSSLSRRFLLFLNFIGSMLGVTLSLLILAYCDYSILLLIDAVLMTVSSGFLLACISLAIRKYKNTMSYFNVTGTHDELSRIKPAVVLKKAVKSP